MEHLLSETLQISSSEEALVAGRELLGKTLEILSGEEALVPSQDSTKKVFDLGKLPFIANFPVPFSYLETREGEEIKKVAVSGAHDLLVGWPFWKTFAVKTPTLLMMLTGKPSMLPIQSRIDQRGVLQNKWRDMRDQGDVEGANAIVDQIAQLNMDIDTNIIAIESMGFREWPEFISNADLFQIYYKIKLMMEVVRYPNDPEQPVAAKLATEEMLRSWSECEKQQLSTRDENTACVEFSSNVIKSFESWFGKVLSVPSAIFEKISCDPTPVQSVTLPNVFQLEQIIAQQRRHLQPCVWQRGVRDAARYKHMTLAEMRQLAAAHRRAFSFSPLRQDLPIDRPQMLYFAPYQEGRELIKLR